MFTTIRRTAAIAALALAASLVAIPAAAAGPAGRTATSPSVAVAALAGVGPSGVAECELLPDPRLPLELGTAVTGGLFKTVAMEKELFRCRAATGDGQRIRDLETFIEVIQNREGKLISIAVALYICDRLFPAGTIKCAYQPVPLGPVTQSPLEGCDIASYNVPNDPVEMNVVANGRVIKTIKVDKEWYRCTNGLREIYQFTEIVEALTFQGGVANGFTTTLTRAFGVVCLKDVPKGIIVGCQRFRTGG